MPRDLAALVKGNDTAPASGPEGIMFGAQAQAANDAAATNSKRDDVHPYTQTLTLSDVDSCVVLEDLAFPPNERASRAKVSFSFPTCHLSPVYHPRSCLRDIPVSLRLLHALAFLS